MRGSGKGWVTAEYSMLPGASPERIRREVSKGSPSGRTHEIQRLIGRSLRGVCDMAALGERQVVVDCDVLQADGGTRTAAITGAYVALHDAVNWLADRKSLAGKVDKVMHRSIQAVSVGIVDGEPRLDLMYLEDVAAEVDMNVVCTGDGDFVEVQGTGEANVFRRDQLDALLDLGVLGCADLAAAQQKALTS
jgi:ribonuclease PH